MLPNESMPIKKLLVVIFLFVMVWEVRAETVKTDPAQLIGLAVRSEAGTFLLSQGEMPLANVPVNFFALFKKSVSGSVELDLVGPVSFTRRGLAEPYGLFEDITFESLPEGDYALRVKIIDEHGAALKAHVFDFKLRANPTALSITDTPVLAMSE